MKFRLGIACGLLAVALTGCGGGDPGEPEASTTPTSSVTSSSPSEEPSETFDPTKETAKQFLRRWIRTSNEMQETGDTTEYRKFSRNCMPCRQFADRIDRIYANGGYVESEGERVLQVKHEGGDQWRLAMRAGATEFIAEEGGEVERSAGGEFDYVVLMERQGSGWSLISYRSEIE